MVLKISTVRQNVGKFLVNKMKIYVQCVQYSFFHFEKFDTLY